MNSGETKKLEIRLFATLREIRNSGDVLEFPVPANLGDIVDTLTIPREQVAIILVNGRHGEFEDTPSDGDIVSIFPPVGGG